MRTADAKILTTPNVDQLIADLFEKFEDVFSELDVDTKIEVEEWLLEYLEPYIDHTF